MRGRAVAAARRVPAAARLPLLPAVRDARAHRGRARARRDDESTAPLGLPNGFDYWSERNAVLDIEPEEVVELLWRALRERVAPVRTEPYELDEDDDDEAAADCPRNARV